MRIIVFIAALSFSAVGSAQSLEFKNFGTVGIGGAGVARPPAGLESYWNPAALAFNENRKSFFLSTLVTASAKGNLIDDLDRLNSATDNRTQPGLPNATSDATKRWDWIHAGMSDSIALAVPFIDMARHSDNVIRAGGGTAIGQNAGNWSFGLIGTIASTVHSAADIRNILPDYNDKDPFTIAEFNRFGSVLPRGPSSTFFSTTQAVTIEQQLISFGITPAAAFNIRNAIDYQFTTANPTKQSPADVQNALVEMVRLSGTGSGGLVANNQSLITVNVLSLNEIPISYGRMVDFHDFGKLAGGITIKAMLARIYTSGFRAYNTDITTVYQRFSNSYSDSANIGIDAGVLWVLGDLALGVTAKNLNAPAFTVSDRGSLVVKPSLRAGVDYTPASWIRSAVDIDITKSNELNPGPPLQMLGGGAELRPFSAFRLRLGGYKNIATDAPAVVTAGLGYAGKLVSVTVDGAYGLGKAAFRGNDYPNEIQLQLSLGLSF